MTPEPTIAEPTPATYESRSARLLTDHMRGVVVWSPDKGWHDAGAAAIEGASR